MSSLMRILFLFRAFQCPLQHPHHCIPPPPLLTNLVMLHTLLCCYLIMVQVLVVELAWNYLMKCHHRRLLIYSSRRWVMHLLHLLIPLASYLLMLHPWSRLPSRLTSIIPTCMALGTVPMHTPTRLRRLHRLCRPRPPLRPRVATMGRSLGRLCGLLRRSLHRPRRLRLCLHRLVRRRRPVCRRRLVLLQLLRHRLLLLYGLIRAVEVVSSVPKNAQMGLLPGMLLV
jgi:hypothetical protein